MCVCGFSLSVGRIRVLAACFLFSYTCSFLCAWCATGGAGVVRSRACFLSFLRVFMPDLLLKVVADIDRIY